MRHILKYGKIRKKDIEFVFYDFDGVMTDGSAFVSEDGKETVRINRGDGMAIEKIKEMGIPQAIISSEKNPVVCKRAEKFGIICKQGILRKEFMVESLLKKYCIDRQKAVFIGNEINDRKAMLYVGCPICPSDANKDIKKLSKIVLKSRGGEGVVREFLDCIDYLENM